MSDRTDAALVEELLALRGQVNALVGPHNEALLSESRLRSRLDAVIRATGCLVYDFTAPLGPALWHGDVHALLGVDNQHVATLPQIMELIHVDDRQQAAHEIAAVLSRPGAFQVKYRLVRPDGRVIHIDSRGTVEQRANGRTHAVGVMNDITYLVEGEAERHRLAAILEATPDFVGICDLEGRTLYKNRAGRAMLGIGPDEDLRHRLIEQYHPRWAARRVLEEGIPAALAQGQWVGETALQGPAGEEIPVSQLILAHRNGSGEVEYFSTIARDISERKRVEQSMRRLLEGTSGTGQEFFSSLVRALAEELGACCAAVAEPVDAPRSEIRTIAMWLNGPAENVTYTTAGTPCEQVLRDGMRFYRDGVQQQFPQDQALIDLGIESYLGIPLHGSDGRTMGLMVVLHTEPLDEARQPVMMMQIFAARAAAELDRLRIERAQLESQRELRHSEQRYRSLVESAHDVVFTLSVDGTILSLNPAFERVTGWNCHEWLGRPMLEILHPDSIGRAVQLLGRVLMGETLGLFELDIMSKSGSRLIGEFTATPEMEDGYVVSVLGIARDITERKQTEAEVLRINEELETRVAERTADLMRINDELRGEITERRRIAEALRAERRMLERSLADHERDRQLTAYEIHDGFVQEAIAAKMYLDTFRAKLSPRQPTHELDLALRQVANAIAEGRRLISGLRPPIIDEQGVVAAIEYLINEHHTPGVLEVEFQHDVQFSRLTPLLEGTMFRIVQETLNNIKRHSQSDRALIRLTQTATHVTLAVRDWGIGFDPNRVQENRYGLQGIRERARLLRGHVVVNSSPGKGTYLVIELPLTLAPTSDGAGDVAD